MLDLPLKVDYTGKVVVVTGAGGLWGGSWGEGAGREASAHKYTSQCPH